MAEEAHCGCHVSIGCCLLLVGVLGTVSASLYIVSVVITYPAGAAAAEDSPEEHRGFGVDIHHIVAVADPIRRVRRCLPIVVQIHKVQRT